MTATTAKTDSSSSSCVRVCLAQFEHANVPTKQKPHFSVYAVLGFLMGVREELLVPVGRDAQISWNPLPRPSGRRFENGFAADHAKWNGVERRRNRNVDGNPAFAEMTQSQWMAALAPTPRDSVTTSVWGRQRLLLLLIGQIRSI